jgi:hypothetical protein
MLKIVTGFEEVYHSIHLNEQQVTVRFQYPVPTEVWAILLWHLQQMLHVVPMRLCDCDCDTVEQFWFRSSLRTGILYFLLEYPDIDRL